MSPGIRAQWLKNCNIQRGWVQGKSDRDLNQNEEKHQTQINKKDKETVSKPDRELWFFGRSRLKGHRRNARKKKKNSQQFGWLKRFKKLTVKASAVSGLEAHFDNLDISVRNGVEGREKNGR